MGLLMLLWPASSDSAEPLAPTLIRVPPGWTTNIEGYFLDEPALQCLVADGESWEATYFKWKKAYDEMADRHTAYVSTSKERLITLQRQIDDERAAWRQQIEQERVAWQIKARKARAPGVGIFAGGAWTPGGIEAAVGVGLVWKVW
jgi:hypothetical protein